MTGPAIHTLRTVELRVGEGPLAFDIENRAAIDAHWQAAFAANPRLWNGPFFLFEDVRLEGGALTGLARATDFATFLYWRDTGRPAVVAHITGTSLPVTRDGVLLAVRMAAHTANAGAIYFPAGSFDAADVTAGRFDVTTNIARELEEETGLAFGDDAEGGFVAVFDRGAIHVARRNRLDGDFAACAGRIARHLSEAGEDEIATVVPIRQGDGSMAVLRPHARALAEWHFENPAFSCSWG